MASDQYPPGFDSRVGEPIQTVLVVGAGWIGRQIVGQLASHGLTVSWLDQSKDALSSGLEWLENHWNEIRAANSGSIEIAKSSNATHVSVQPFQNMEQVSGGMDLVLETVTEQISVKRRVLENASKSFPNPTIIASNSSYFTPSILMKFVAEPERFAHFHFHVPVWQTRLIDIASSPQTSETTVSRLTELAHRIGQHPLVQKVENPGYVFNWMLRAVLQSALQLRVKNVASPQEIDIAWKKATGMAVGPFGMMDQIGLDLVYQTMSSARFVDGDDVWQPLLDQLSPLIESGKLGVKTGGGFYPYPQESSGQTT